MALSGYIETPILVNITLAGQPAVGADHSVQFLGPDHDPGEASISPTLMFFTNANWSTPQILTVVPHRAGSVYIDYEINTSYTGRKKTGAFNVTVNPLPPNTIECNDLGFYSIENGGVTLIQGTAFTINIQLVPGLGSYPTLSVISAGSATPGTVNEYWIGPDGTKHSGWPTTFTVPGSYTFYEASTLQIGGSTTAVTTYGRTGGHLTLGLYDAHGTLISTASYSGNDSCALVTGAGYYTAGGSYEPNTVIGTGSGTNSMTAVWLVQGAQGIWTFSGQTFNNVDYSPSNPISVNLSGSAGTPSGTTGETFSATGSYVGTNGPGTSGTSGFAVTFDLACNGTSIGTINYWCGFFDWSQP